MAPGFVRHAVILGLISAIGPFAIDMYLPALPAIGADLGADVAAVQMTLTVYFIAVATTQVIYGPLSDRYGRRAPLMFGLGLFVIASAGCALAPNVETLIAWRFVQALGACAGVVIPRAIVRDLHEGPEAARLMALMMMVFGVSPVAAPLVGSLLTAAFGWRAIFWTVGAAGLAGIVLVVLLLPETRSRDARTESGIRPALAAYRLLLRDRGFLGLSLIGGLGMSTFFSYLATSAFIFIDRYGLTPLQYGVVFGVNAVAFIGAAQINGLIAERVGLRRLVLRATRVMAATTALLLVLVLAGVEALPVLIALLFMAFGCLGFIMPSTAVLALAGHGPIAGTASALMGTLHLVTGAIVIALVSAVFDGTLLPMVGGITACALGAFLVARATLGDPYGLRPAGGGKAAGRLPSGREGE